MPFAYLNNDEYRLLRELRKEAERILKEVPEAEQAEALSRLYAWRNDKIVTASKKS